MILLFGFHLNFLHFELSVRKCDLIIKCHLQIVILMPAVCSICYHTYKHKYGLEQEPDTELGEVQVFLSSSLASKIGKSNTILLERIENTGITYNNKTSSYQKIHLV